MTKPQKIEGGKENTTYCDKQFADLTLEDITEAISKIEVLPKKKMVMCRKHWFLLRKALEIKDTSNPMFRQFGVGSLTGIPVEIKPYLKKVRIYTETL